MQFIAPNCEYNGPIRRPQRCSFSVLVFVFSYFSFPWLCAVNIDMRNVVIDVIKDGELLAPLFI